MSDKPKQRRGFALIDDPAKRREMAAKGGRSVDPSNRSFSKDPDLASKAGALGGAKSRGGGRPRVKK